PYLARSARSRDGRSRVAWSEIGSGSRRRGQSRGAAVLSRLRMAAGRTGRRMEQAGRRVSLGLWQRGAPMNLLPEASLIKTGPVDHADWNYRPLLGVVQRTRFRLIDKLLDDERVDRILEVGYGSGVLMPHLKGMCRELYGIDIHPHASEVEEVLRRHEVEARLVSGSVVDLPYEDAF